jgi:predicted TPR repeat methyltransferase
MRPRCSRLVGIDLSPHMVELARRRGIYDSLEVAELSSWLGACREKFDVIVACDTLIYFGDLRQAIVPAADLLEDDGLFVLSLEKGGDDTLFRLSDNGRYTHHPDHVRDAASEAGLIVAALEEGYLRMEYGEEVTGLFVALLKG